MRAAPPQDGKSRKGALILGGAHGSLEIARSLGRRGIPVWLVTDDNPLATLSRYVERSFSWQGARGNEAIVFLTELAARYRLNGWVLFAGGDVEVRFIAQNHAALAAVFALTTPPWNVVRWAYDKRNMNARAAELGLVHPLSHYPRTRDDLASLRIRYPVVLKPTIYEGRSAFGSAKAWRADDPRALLALYDKAIALAGADCVMVQELVPGDGNTQFSYAAVWNGGTPIGSLVARRRRQYPIDFGFTSTFVQTIELDEIVQASCRFLSSLDYSGLVEIEFKYDTRDRSYKILDVNARAWTWIALGAAAGVDFADMQWRLAQGERPDTAVAVPGVSWRYLSRDLVAGLQEMMTGAVSPIDYLRSWRSSWASAVFAWDDPWPAALDLPLVATRVARRRLRRGERDTGGALQSAKLRY